MSGKDFTTCPVDHAYAMRDLPPVTFDPEAARGLTTDEIRKRWPRGYWTCPECGSVTTRYASTKHYFAGDW